MSLLKSTLEAKIKRKRKELIRKSGADFIKALQEINELEQQLTRLKKLLTHQLPKAS